MTKSIKIGILQADHVVKLAQASIEINFGIEIVHQNGRALPPREIENFIAQIPILTQNWSLQKNKWLKVFYIF